jgi:hypothetical protein
MGPSRGTAQSQVDQVAEKVQKPLADARGSKSGLRVCRTFFRILLLFNKAAVTRYRIHSGSGLLSLDLAAGIRWVKRAEEPRRSFGQLVHRRPGTGSVAGA